MERLQFQDTEGYAVHIQHHVGTLGVCPFDRHFFGYGKVVIEGIFPVDQKAGLSVLANVLSYFHAVAKKAVYFFVDVIEAFDLVSGGFVKLI
jgi:hypothetical protein